MKDIYKKYFSLFSNENTRVLIITNEDNCVEESICKQNSRTVDFISLRNIVLGQLICDQFIFINNKAIDRNRLYDLVILDQICDAPLLCINLSLIWKTRQEMFSALSKHIKPQGSMVILTQNTLNIRKISNLFNALINLFIQTHSSGTFHHQLTDELKKEKFLRFDYFYIYPNFNVVENLISTDPKGLQEMMSHKYGIPFDVYRRPRFWLRWFFTRIQLDRWLLCCQMIWVRK